MCVSKTFRSLSCGEWIGLIAAGFMGLCLAGGTLGCGLAYQIQPSAWHSFVACAIVATISVGGSAGFLIHRAWTIRSKENEDQKAVNAARKGLEGNYTRL